MNSTVPAPLQLFSGPLSMFGAKVQIAMLEKGLDFSVTMVDFDWTLGYTPRHPEVLRINPKRQVPVLIHGELELFDSTQIFEYLEELQPQPALWPAGIVAKARARLLEHQSDEVYFPHIIRLMGLQKTLDDPAALAAIEAASRFYGQMETLLTGRDHLAGPYSFADIAFFMAQLFGERLGAPMSEATPRLLAWRGRMCQRPAVRTVAGAMGRWLAAQGQRVPAFLKDMV